MHTSEEIDLEIGHSRTFQTSVTLTLTLDWIGSYSVPSCIVDFYL